VRTSWAVVGTALALTWAGPAAAEPAFTVAVAHTGSEPDGVAIADVTGDGRDDLLVQTGYDPGDKNNWKLFVFPSLEDGTLGAATSYPTDEYNNFNQAGLGTGDLDGDGDDDVAVPTHAGVDLYYQQNGSLEGPQLIPETQGVQEATILDIDGDGSAELLVDAIPRPPDTVGPWHEGLYVVRNVEGTWTRSSVSANFQLETEIADLSDDGRLDIVAIGEGVVNAGIEVRVFAQDGEGAFTEQLLYRAEQYQLVGLETADVTGDGLVDVLVGSGPWNDGQRLLIFRQVEGGVSPTPTSHPALEDIKALATADLTGDGQSDVVALHYDGDLSYAAQQEAGGLGPFVRPPIDYGLFSGPTHPYPRGLVLGDLVGDARIDLVVAGGAGTPGAGVFEHVDAPPDTVITAGPTGGVTTSTASFSFSSTLESSTFECALGFSGWAPCESPTTYPGLADGHYTFFVRAINDTGFADLTPAKRDWLVDTTPPTTGAPRSRLVVGSRLGVSSIPVRVEWSGSDVMTAIDHYELEEQIGDSWVPIESTPETSAMLAIDPGRHVYRVRATDQVGNVGAWANGASFVLRALQETASAIDYSDGWRRVSMSSAYGGAIARTTTHGAKAALKVRTRGLALVARKGPNCGRAAVYVDGNRVTTVDLFATATATRTIVFRRAWSSSEAGEHRIIVRALGTKNEASSGTYVDVDAILVVR
jgi:hypothetical protein